MFAPWRNTLAKSKRKHNAPSHNNNTYQKMGLCLAWWHPEEIPWLSRSRSKMRPSHNNENSKKMVAPWRNILVMSKQKHNAPSHNNDNSDNYGVGLAWWQPEEIHWLSRRSIMPLPTMTIMKNLGVYGVAWRHPKEIPRLSRSRTIMPPSHNNDNSKKNWV